MALSEETLEKVCRMGKGEQCCRYLAMQPGEGMCCKKLDPSFKALLDQRVVEGTMAAKGDNCPGVVS